jgi:hypothetical protein
MNYQGGIQMRNALILTGAVVVFAIALMGFTQHGTGRYQIVADRETAWMVDTSTGEISAYAIVLHNEQVRERYVKKIAGMPKQ